MGAGSTGLGSIIKTSAAKIAKSTDDITSTELAGGDRRSVIRQALSDPEFVALYRHIRTKGWDLRWKNATVKHVVDGNASGGYDFIVVDGTPRGPTRDETEDLVLFWFGNETIELTIPDQTFGHHLRSNNNGVASETNENIFGYDEASFLKVENGSVLEDSRDFDIDIGEAEPKSIPEPDPGNPGGGEPVGCSNGWCEVDIQQIDDLDWKCIARIVGSFVGTVGSCATCILTLNPATCGLCIWAGGLMVGTIDGCMSPSGAVIQRNVDCEWLNENDIDCHTYWTLNDDVMPVKESFLENEMPIAE